MCLSWQRRVGGLIIAHADENADILGILQEDPSFVSNMLDVDCQITHNGFSGTW
jgi:hypothetical protein